MSMNRRLPIFIGPESDFKECVVLVSSTNPLYLSINFYNKEDPFDIIKVELKQFISTWSKYNCNQLKMIQSKNQKYLVYSFENKTYLYKYEHPIAYWYKDI